MLARLGEKIAKVFGEQDLGIPANSYFESILEGYGRQFMMADLFLYDSYDEQTQLFRNQDSIGFVLETLPLIGASEEMQKEVSRLTTLNSSGVDLSMPIALRASLHAARSAPNATNVAVAQIARRIRYLGPAGRWRMAPI